jgi:hypothetical protein
MSMRRYDVPQHFGRESDSIWTTGDFDGDGRTSLADWGLLQSHLGQSAASPSVRRSRRTGILASGGIACGARLAPLPPAG